MTEKQAWLRVADIWKAAVRSPYRRGEWCVYVPNVLDDYNSIGYGPIWGLCTVIYRLYVNGMIDDATRTRMEDKIPPRIYWDHNYSWPFTKRGAQARVRFCLRMAKQLPD